MNTYIHLADFKRVTIDPPGTWVTFDMGVNSTVQITIACGSLEAAKALADALEQGIADHRKERDARIAGL